MKINNINLKKSIYNFKTDFLRTIPKIYSKPSQLTISTTERCNSRCITCLFWKNKNTKDIPKEYILKFIDESIDWLGPREFILDGGEPLLRKDIFHIINHIHRKRGYSKLLTNGLLLDTKTIDKLVQSKIFNIVISLNGVDSKVHDSSRGVPGNLLKIFTAVDYIKKNYPHLTINFAMIIYKQNLDQIIPTIEYANNVGIYIHFHMIQPIFFSSNFINDKKNYKSIFRDLIPNNTNKVAHIFNEIKRYKSKGYLISMYNSYLNNYLYYFSNQNKRINKRCKIGYDNLMLTNNGDVKLCGYYPPIGNIKVDNLKEIWNSKIAKKQRKQMLNCSINCPVTLCNLRPNIIDIFEKFIVLTKKRLINQ